MKHLPLSVAFLLVLSAQAFAANTEDRNPNVLHTNVAGTRTIAAPPATFDPLTAGDEQLAYWGFPPRPNPAESPEDYAGWARAMRASKTRIVPQLRESKTKPWHGDNLPAQGDVSDGIKPMRSNNWGGYLHESGAKKYGSSSYFYIITDTVVPVASQAFGTCSGGWYYSGNWIGLGGFSEVALLQAGIEYDAYCNSGNTQSQYKTWYEFFPANEAYIDNLPISPGDDLFLEVWQTSPVEGHVYVVNINSDLAVELDYDAPSGTRLIANTAEWIIERPGGSPLVNFISDFFWNASAYTEKNKKADPGDSIPITLTDDSNNNVAYPTKLSNTTFQMEVEGSAY